MKIPIGLCILQSAVAGLVLSGCSHPERRAAPRPALTHTLMSSQARMPGLAFSPDGRFLVVNTDSGLALWSTSTWKTARFIPGPYGLGSFSPNGRQLATFGGSSVQLWNASNWRQAFTLGLEQAVEDVEWSPDGRLLAILAGHHVSIWDLKSKSRVDQLAGSVSCIAFGPDNQQIAAASPNRTITLYQVQDGKPFKNLPDSESYTARMRFSPDDQYLARVSDESRDIPSISVWVTSGMHEVSLTENAGENDVGFSPDGSFLAVASFRDVTILNTSDWTIAGVLHGGPDEAETGPDNLMARVAWSPGGRQVAAQDDKGAIYIWDTAAARLHRRPEMEASRQD